MQSTQLSGLILTTSDELGRVADFHALRYTYCTYLQRNGVPSRLAMDLMRHSDRKLTDKIYTDTQMLPTAEAVNKLPAEEALTGILTVISGKTSKTGRFVSQRTLLSNPQVA